MIFETLITMIHTLVFAKVLPYFGSHSFGFFLAVTVFTITLLHCFTVKLAVPAYRKAYPLLAELLPC